LETSPADGLFKRIALIFVNVILIFYQEEKCLFAKLTPFGRAISKVEKAE
jgi:hypothetical protein